MIIKDLTPYMFVVFKAIVFVSISGFVAAVNSPNSRFAHCRVVQ